MKLNLYRKLILIIFSILIFISCVLYVPFKISNFSGIDYWHKTIWSNGELDYHKLLIEIFVLIIIFGTAFLFTGKLSNPDFNDKNVKRIIKRELLFILCLLIVFGVLYFSLSLFVDTWDNDVFNFYVVLIIIVIFSTYPLRLIIYYTKRLIKYLNS